MVAFVSIVRRRSVRFYLTDKNLVVVKRNLLHSVPKLPLTNMRKNPPLFVLLIALLMLSATARAQVLYESNGAAGTVGAYNALTGATINSNFINNSGSGDTDQGMAFDPITNILYVQHSSTISEYATTGAVINASFITGLTNNPFGLALSGGDLYVTNQGNNTVGEYNASTGATINASLINTGLSTPRGILVLGNTLYVVNRGTGTISTFNATTGASITPNFITGLVGPSGLTVSGTNLWVANTDSNSVGEYNVNTGAAIAPNFITGVIGDFDVKYFNGDLYVTERNIFLPQFGIGLFDANTGAAIHNPFINLPNGPIEVLVVPEASTWLTTALASALLAFQILRAAAFSRRLSARKR